MMWASLTVLPLPCPAWLPETYHTIGPGSSTLHPPGDADSLTKLLAPFLRIAKTSPQFTVEIAQHGFVPVVLELLQTQHAPAQRDLLSIIHVIYEHYPRPKELIVKYRLQEHLRLLTGNRRGEAAVLVQTQAQRLLDAFQINMVL